MHFENLWENCENYHIKNNDNSDLSSIIDEVIIKINLIKVIDVKSEISKEDKDISKQQLLGEILFLLAKISLKENINVFKALMRALAER